MEGVQGLGPSLEGLLIVRTTETKSTGTCEGACVMGGRACAVAG